MNLKQHLQDSYVLHTRPYRETSMLVELLSCEHGRITLVARGAKRAKNQVGSLLQPFLPLQVSWHGNGDLVTLIHVESQQPGPILSGRSAICGLYMNELLVKLLPKWDSCSVLYQAYAAALQELADTAVTLQVILRRFEMQLLKSLGYGLQLERDITTGASIEADGYYIFDPIQGPKLVGAKYAGAIKGESLIALASENWQTPGVLVDMKRLMRVVLNHHLGSKKLTSRELL